MTGLAFIGVNILFLPAHIVLARQLRRSRVLRRRTVIIINTALALLLFIYILLNNAIFSGFTRRELNSYWEISGLYVVLESAILLILSPYFWVAFLHFLNRIFYSRRVRKRSRIRGSFDYYRDDLLKIHPGLVSFVYKLREDARSDIASVLMKLRLEGFITEEGGRLRATGKDEEDSGGGSLDGGGEGPGGGTDSGGTDGGGRLFVSEKLILGAVRGAPFDLRKYYDTVAREALALGLIKKPRGKVFVKILKILACFILPALVYMLPYMLSDLEDNLREQDILRTPDGVFFIRADKEIFDKYDYRVALSEVQIGSGEYFAIINDAADDRKAYESIDYKTDEVSYFVRLDLLLGLPGGRFTQNSLGTVYAFLYVLFVLSLVAGVSLLVTQIKYFRSDYLRTSKGAALVNEAFGLKNYLKDFSIIGRREGEELPLWEYYLIYAVALDVNVRIEDALIESFAGSMR